MRRLQDWNANWTRAMAQKLTEHDVRVHGAEHGEQHHLEVVQRAPKGGA